MSGRWRSAAPVGFYSKNFDSSEEIVGRCRHGKLAKLSLASGKYVGAIASARPSAALRRAATLLSGAAPAGCLESTGLARSLYAPGPTPSRENRPSVSVVPIAPPPPATIKSSTRTRGTDGGRRRRRALASCSKAPSGSCVSWQHPGDAAFRTAVDIAR